MSRILGLLSSRSKFVIAEGTREGEGQGEEQRAQEGGSGQRLRAGGRRVREGA